MAFLPRRFALALCLLPFAASFAPPAPVARSVSRRFPASFARGRSAEEDREVVPVVEDLGWYCIQVAAGSERFVQNMIGMVAEQNGWQQNITQVIAPMEKLLTSRGSKVGVEERAIYPGCVFVRMNMNGELHSTVMQINRVISFVGTDIAGLRRQRHHVLPQQMGDEEVERMLKIVESGAEDPLLRGDADGLAIGDMVRIVRGGGRGNEEGAIRSIRRGMLVVRCWGYGKYIDLQVRPQDVVKLTESEVRAYMANDPSMDQPIKGRGARSGKAGTLDRRTLDKMASEPFVPPSKRAAAPADGSSGPSSSASASSAPAAPAADDAFDADAFFKELDNMMSDGEDPAAGATASASAAPGASVFGADVEVSVAGGEGAGGDAAAPESEDSFFSALMSELEGLEEEASSAEPKRPTPQGRGPPQGAAPPSDEALDSLFSELDMLTAPASTEKAEEAPAPAQAAAPAATAAVEDAGAAASDDAFFDALMDELGAGAPAAPEPSAAAAAPRTAAGGAAEEDDASWAELFSLLDDVGSEKEGAAAAGAGGAAASAVDGEDGDEDALFGGGAFLEELRPQQAEAAPAAAQDLSWIDGLKVAELKEECRSRGLKVGGTKQVLADRLREFLSGDA